MCGNESLAEEITQETFVKALNNIHSYQGRGAIKVWLCQIAKHTLYTHLSKHKKISDCSDSDTENNLASLDQSIINSLVQQEEALRIHKIIHKMKEPYKEVFTLRIFGELSFIQISQLFNKSESWARVTFYRAKQMIHKKLEEEGSID